MSGTAGERARYDRGDPFERADDRAYSDREWNRRERSARRQRTGLRIHAAAYVSIQVMIVAIWLVTWKTGGTSYPWFVFPLAGWTVGLACHWAAVKDSVHRRPEH